MHEQVPARHDRVPARGAAGLRREEEREQGGEPDISAEEREPSADEIAELFADLLDEDVPEEAEKYINLMLGHMVGEHIEEHNGD